MMIMKDLLRCFNLNFISRVVFCEVYSEGMQCAFVSAKIITLKYA